MKLYNNLPLYEALIENEDEGTYCLSLVTYPATEVSWETFGNAEKMLKFTVENQEKRLVRSLVMAANMPIYRRTENGFEYYIVYSADTLRKMAEKYLADGLQNQFDTQHNDHMEQGINMVQFFIKDSTKGINPVGFEDYDDGSLFCELHITNDDVWSKIKDGTFQGISLAGYFSIEPVEEVTDEDKEVEEVLSLLEKINKKINNYRHV